MEGPRRVTGGGRGICVQKPLWRRIELRRVCHSISWSRFLRSVWEVVETGCFCGPGRMRASARVWDLA